MRFFFATIFLICGSLSFSQNNLQPGFDAKEHITLAALSRYGISFPDTILAGAKKENYRLAYRSPEVGLKNQWSFFIWNNVAGIISIRGTVADKESWLANFYAAMIPATGTLHLTDSTIFSYKLADDPRAAVHAGWTVSLGFMAADILEKVEEHYSKGIKNIYLYGHSQGGAIAFLTTSYLRHLQKDGKLPQDLTFKTYCSAGPKPGNTYYAYDYEFITRGGWGFNVINTEDWVPETPYTVQRMQDMNEINPLIHTKQGLKKQGAGARLVGGYVYGKMNRKPRKLQRMYNRMFGKTIYNFALKKTLTQYENPRYAESANYVRAGTPIVLMPDEGYKSRFKFNEKKKDYFVHHYFGAYYYLLKKYYLK